MLSRVADSLYWMRRYLERAENTVRQLDATMSLMLDPGGASAETRWDRLLSSPGGPKGLKWSGDLESMAHHLVFGSGNPASVIYCVNGARENARQVREEISSEQWQRLNRLFHQIRSPQADTNSAPASGRLMRSIVFERAIVCRQNTDRAIRLGTVGRMKVIVCGFIRGHVCEDVFPECSAPLPTQL